MPPMPPSVRSRAALGLTAAAALGRLELQVCNRCAAVQYPPREACVTCLCDDLRWRRQEGAGELLATTALHVSNDPYFRERLPWHVAMVRLDCGPTVVAHLHSACPPAPARVRVSARLDKAGQGVLVAFPFDEEPNMTADRQLREWTCDPASRTALVTDGASAVGQSLVRNLVSAGAALVWAGVTESSKDSAGVDAITALPQVALVSLDVTDAASVRDLAGEIGERVDIIINNSEARATQESDPRQQAARDEMDVNYFGLLRLVEEFAPILQSRARAGKPSAVAWLNILSVYALSSFPALGTYSASKAAALSLSQCLRAQMRTAGLRVINIFPGPVDDERNQVPSPKLSAEALASAIVAALRDGVEDVYPGDVAQEWLARWRENPKGLERELSA